MKKLVLLSILIVLCAIGKAQFAFNVRFVNEDVYGSAGQTELKATGYIINTSGQKATFIWQLSKGSTPNSWEVNVSDKTTNYPPSTSFGSIVIENGDSAVINIHLNPAMASGAGDVTLTVADQADPFDMIDAPITYHVWAVNVPEMANTRSSELFSPNPATNTISLTTPITQPLYIEIYNSIGQLQLSHTISPQNPAIPVSTLPKGLYIIRYTNSKGNVISQKIKKEGIN